jgi:hypothetical protein
MSEHKEHKKEINVDSPHEVVEILDAVSDKIPKIIKGLMDSLYSKEAGTNIGQSVGAFYKELLAAGIPQETANELVKEFSFSMKNFNFNKEN